jgi:putative ABC transport system permease protein
MTPVLVRLAFAGLRHRALQAVLTVLVVSAAAAALTIAVGIDRVADRSWDRTFEATNGAHVTVFSGPGGTDAAAIEQLPGVTGSTGDVALVQSMFRRDGKRYGVMLLGTAGSQPPQVSRPLVDAGRWPSARGEVALERSFARFLGLRPGDAIAVAGTPLRVTGVVIVPKSEPYPQSQPGQAFASTDTLALVEPDRNGWGHLVGVRLDDPMAARAFALEVVRIAPRTFVDDWLAERDDARAELLTVRVVLDIYGTLLLLAGGFVLATLIGGRVLAQTREIGLLKAAGLTPGQVTQAFVLEQLALGFAGVLLGIAIGTLATPLFVSRSASLLNASEVPPLDVLSALRVLAIVLAAVAVSAAVPSLRAGRRTTAALLAGAGSGAARRARLAPFSLPLPLALGLREAFVRPGRTFVTMLALALTVASLTATLGMEASFDVDSVAMGGVADPVNDDAAEEATLRPVVYGLDGVLLLVGGVNLLATVLLGLRERVRDAGLLKAVGLTPRQVTASFVSSQLAVAAGAVVIGIPFGLGLFRWAVGVTGGTDEFAYPAWWWLALLAPLTLGVVAAIAAPLARRSAAASVVDALRYE